MLHCCPASVFNRLTGIVYLLKYSVASDACHAFEVLFLSIQTAWRGKMTSCWTNLILCHLVGPYHALDPTTGSKRGKFPIRRTVSKLTYADKAEDDCKACDPKKKRKREKHQHFLCYNGTNLYLCRRCAKVASNICYVINRTR